MKNYKTWIIRNEIGQYLANYIERTPDQALRNYRRDNPRHRKGAVYTATEHCA